MEQITSREVQLQKMYMELNKEQFQKLCSATEKKLTGIQNDFVEAVLTTCSDAKKITFKQFKVLYNFCTGEIPEYRDFN